MRVLIIGSGGREHALAWKVARSPLVTELFCAPGNAGMASLAECIDIKATDIPALKQFALSKGVDLAIVGPESPLIAGIADELRSVGIGVFGPSKSAAALEGSKVFAKRLMAKYGIPTADFRVFDDPTKARACIEDLASGDSCPIVVKADGEAAGKGVFVCDTRGQALEAIETIMVRREFGASGDQLIIEERLKGQEASLMVITDGQSIVPLVPSQDHKRAYDDDKGPNTGGMGCYSPVPAVTPELYDQALEKIVRPTIKAMNAERRPYTGVLYAGIILTESGMQVLEFNVRFGDPETQVVLPLLETDLLEIIQAATSGSLDSLAVKWYNGCAVCVVVASGGYPAHYEIGKPIFGLRDAESVEGVTVFHAGTKSSDGQVVTSGGRVLGVTGVGDTFETAIDRAYSAVKAISFEDMHYRRDIGKRALMSQTTTRGGSA